jgi:hypothetical protein
MGIFSSTKDRFIEQAALSYINRMFGAYGQATSLKIDSEAKTISLELDLKGEVSPVTIKITDYSITEEAGRFFLGVRHVETSREWLTGLANSQIGGGKRFEIPEQAGRWLIKML